MSDNSQDPVIDSDNPEWTQADFRKARAADATLPPEILAQFGQSGRQSRTSPSGKIPVALELSPEVLSYFKATGPGWQERIDEALKRSIAK